MTIQPKPSAEETPAGSLQAPLATPETQAYFDGLARGALMVKRCRVCGEYHHYPRSLCPFCFSADIEWTEASGEGVIYSYSVVRAKDGKGYVIGYVTLPDCGGVSLMTNIVDCDPDALRVGQAVQVTFGAAQDGSLAPLFRPLPGN